MEIQFTLEETVNGLLTITVGEDDYLPAVNKQLKDLRRKAQIPGFRPGTAPMAMIQRQYGATAKYDAVNKVVDEQLSKYIADNHLRLLGQPMVSDKQTEQDLDNATTFTFYFDLALEPSFDITLDKSDTINYYSIIINDELIDKQVKMFAESASLLQDVDSYEEHDVLHGTLTELNEDGSVKDGGITQSEVLIMPDFVNDDDQKALFTGTTVGDTIVINPRKMYGDTELAAMLNIEKENIDQHTGDFHYTITSISRQLPAKGQELYDRTFGEGVCHSDEEFRQMITDGLTKQLKEDADYRFLDDLKAYAKTKIGELTFPDTLLKKFMRTTVKDDKEREAIDEEYPEMRDALEWQLIRNKLVTQLNVTVDANDVQAQAIVAAQAEFAQYGMRSAPKEYVDEYAKRLLNEEKSREQIVFLALNFKLAQAVKDNVNINNIDISLDDFNHLDTNA